MKEEEIKPIKKGDTVLVDVGFNNGGYEAKVLEVGEIFAFIESDNQKWYIMKGRLTHTQPK
jgi:ribosomal protein L24